MHLLSFHALHLCMTVMENVRTYPMKTSWYLSFPSRINGSLLPHYRISSHPITSHPTTSNQFTINTKSLTSTTLAPPNHCRSQSILSATVSRLFSQNKSPLFNQTINRQVYCTILDFQIKKNQNDLLSHSPRRFGRPRLGPRPSHIVSSLVTHFYHTHSNCT